MNDARTQPIAKVPEASLRECVAFRLAGQADVDSFVPMINEAYMREAWLLPAPRVDTATLTAELAQRDCRLIMAEVEGALAGAICLWLRDDPYFGLLAVAPRWQGRGLASMLVAEVERLTRAAGRTELRLDCAKELNLPSFYETLGYTVEREVPNHYYARGGVRTGPITRVDMVKVLR